MALVVLVVLRLRVRGIGGKMDPHYYTGLINSKAQDVLITVCYPYYVGFYIDSYKKKLSEEILIMIHYVCDTSRKRSIKAILHYRNNSGIYLSLTSFDREIPSASV